MTTPDHVIPFRLPAWLGWACAFVLLLATGYFAISNFNARQQADALRAQAQSSDIEAKSLKNLLTAEQLISAKQIEALKAAQAEVARLQTGYPQAGNHPSRHSQHTPPKLSEDQIYGKKTYGPNTITLICDGPGGSTGMITATDSSGAVLFHGSLKIHQSTSFPHTNAVTIEVEHPGNLRVSDERRVIYDGGSTGTESIGYGFRDENNNIVNRITILAPPK